MKVDYQAEEVMARADVYAALQQVDEVRGVIGLVSVPTDADKLQKQIERLRVASDYLERARAHLYVSINLRRGFGGAK